MEMEFLFQLNWHAYVSPLEFIQEWVKIENLVIKNEGRKREFSLTYNEIMRIFENDVIFQKLFSIFLSYTSKFILISSFVYSSLIISLILLTRSTVLEQNSLIALNQNLIANQSINYGNYYNVGQNEKDTLKEQINDERIEPNEQEGDVKGLEEKLFDLHLNLKTLNLNKLNNLDLNELNNKLNIFKTILDDTNIKPNIYSIETNGDRKCQFSNLNQFFKNFRLTFEDYNLNDSDYRLEKDISFAQTFRKLFPNHEIC
jgi:hypothetical protein